MTARTERSLVCASPRLRQGLDRGDHWLTEIRKRPRENTRRWRRALRRAPIAGMQPRPHLGAPLGPSPLLMRHGRQRAGAPFDRRRGPLQGAHPVGRPCWPRLAGWGRKAWGERLLAHGAWPRLPCWPSGGWPAGTARVGHRGLPRDPWEQALCSPRPLPGGEGRGGHLPSAPCPPAVPQGRQGWSRLADLRDGRLPGQPRLARRAHGAGLHRRLQGAGNLGGGLGRRVRHPAGRPRARAGLHVGASGGGRLGLSRSLRVPRGHPRRGLWSRRSRVGPSLEAGHRLQGVREGLGPGSHAPAKGQGRARDDRRREGEASGPPAALQPRCGAGPQGLGPVTAQGQPPGSQGLQPRLPRRFPRRSGPRLGPRC